MDDKLQNVIHLIEVSDLDQTIKDILIRDLTQDGLTDFLKEQIKAYCLDGIKKIDEKVALAEQLLNEKENPEIS